MDFLTWSLEVCAKTIQKATSLGRAWHLECVFDCRALARSSKCCDKKRKRSRLPFEKMNALPLAHSSKSRRSFRHSLPSSLKFSQIYLALLCSNSLQIYSLLLIYKHSLKRKEVDMQNAGYTSNNSRPLIILAFQ